MPLFAPPISRQVLLGYVLGANFNSTGDTAISMRTSPYVVRRITVKNASISLTTAAGGVYTAPSKGGTAIVVATQVYTALTAAAKVLDMTLAAILTTDVRTEAELFFSLTTAQGAAATADIFVFGDDLSN